MKTIAMAAALASGLALGPVAAQEGDGVWIVYVLNLTQDATPEEALAELRPVLDYVREQPGLIEEQMLRGTVGNSQDYVHVMRWQRAEDWEAMFADQAFLDILRGADPGFEPATAEVYLPVQ